MGNPEHPSVTAIRANNEIAKQTTYDGFVRGPELNLDLDPPAQAFEVLTDGNIEVTTGRGNQKIFPASKGRIYPIKIIKLFSNNTTVSKSEIILYFA